MAALQKALLPAFPCHTLANPALALPLPQPGCPVLPSFCLVKSLTILQGSCEPTAGPHIFPHWFPPSLNSADSWVNHTLPSALMFQLHVCALSAQVDGKLPGIQMNFPSSSTQHNAITITDIQLIVFKLFESKFILVRKFLLIRKWSFYFVRYLEQLFLFSFHYPWCKKQYFWGQNISILMIKFIH